jgi:hypothetical protein
VFSKRVSVQSQAASNQSDSNTANPALTSMFTQRVNKPTSKLSRAVGLLLVVFILYGTTVEAAHRHGRILRSSSNTASFHKQGTADSPLGSKTGCSDCLICQLHQNFTATLISIGPNAEALDTHKFSARLDPVSIQSRFTTPRSGRAPPQAN